MKANSNLCNVSLKRCCGFVTVILPPQSGSVGSGSLKCLEMNLPKDPDRLRHISYDLINLKMKSDLARWILLLSMALFSRVESGQINLLPK